MFSQSVVIVFKFQTIFSVEVSRRLVCDDDDDDELYSCVDVFNLFIFKDNYIIRVCLSLAHF